MHEIVTRREFLTNAWKTGFVLVGVAGAVTSWDLLQPLRTAGFGGKVRAIPADAVPDVGAVDIPAARAYLVRLNGEIVALSEKCTHLGCRVPYCPTSNQFECPCHGSNFNRAGEYRTGPAPRGMDRYPVEIDENGMVLIDTSEKLDGPAPGGETINEPVAGPSCSSGEET